MARTEITITDDMSQTLGYAGIGPIYTEEYAVAREREDWEAVEAMEAVQDSLADTAGEAWSAAAVRIGAEMGYEVEAIDTRDASVLHSATRTYVDHRGRQVDEDDENCDGTIEQTIWQAAHDATPVGLVNGAWTVVE